MSVEKYRVLDGEIDSSDIIVVRGIKTTRGYYQDDLHHIQRISQKWHFEKREDLCRQIPDYAIIKLTTRGSFNIGDIRFCCERMIMEGQVYGIESGKLTSVLEEDFKKCETISRRFNSRKEGRIFWAVEKENARLIAANKQTPDWILFDGYFRFRKHIPNEFKAHRSGKEFIAFINKERQNLHELLKHEKYNFHGANRDSSQNNAVEFRSHDLVEIVETTPLKNDSEIIFDVKCSKGLYDGLKKIEKTHFHFLPPLLKLEYKA